MATSPRRSPRIRLDRAPTWACGIGRRLGRRPHCEAALEKTGRARRVERIGGAEPEGPDLPTWGRGGLVGVRTQIRERVVTQIRERVVRVLVRQRGRVRGRAVSGAGSSLGGASIRPARGTILIDCDV